MAALSQSITIGGKKYVVDATAKKKTPIEVRALNALGRAVLWVLRVTLVKPAGLLVKHSARQAWRGLTHVLRESTRGKTRAMWVPMWVAAAAALPVPDATLGWLTLAVLVEAATWVPPRTTWPARVRRLVSSRTWLSARERRLAVCVCATVALWHDQAPLAPWWVAVPVLNAAVVGWSVPWWQGRRIREKAPDAVHPLQQAWGYALTEYPDLAGAWRDVEDMGDRQVGVLRLASGDPEKAAGMAAAVEVAIDRHAPYSLPPGALDISRDRSLPSARDIRVVLMRDPRKSTNVIHYWDGPTLQDDGSFIAGYTIGGRPIMGRLYRAGGAVNNLILGGPGSGKGGASRTIGLESACAGIPGTDRGLCYRVGADGKHGAGMPELAATFDYFARTPEEWGIALGMSIAVLQSRLARYGADGRSRWHWRIDPLWRLTLDEIVTIAQKYPKLATDMEQYVAQGRSLGCAADANTQRGGGDDMWSTRFRANLRGNGTISIGQQGDTTVGMLATQDTMVDLTRLPQTPGYMFAVSKVEQGIPLEPFRYRYSVSREEAAEGIDIGSSERTVDDWAVSPLIRRAVLHDDDLAAIAPWLERAGVPVEPVADPLLVEPAEQDAWWYKRGETAEEMQAAMQSTLDRAFDALPEVGAVSAQDVAARAGVSERQARNLLNSLAEPAASDRGPVAVKVGPNQWRRAS